MRMVSSKSVTYTAKRKMSLVSEYKSSPSGAFFSSCRKNRFALWRIWDGKLPVAMCIGINPSHANEEQDDPTIRILRGVLANLDFGGLVMTNLYSLISSTKEVLATEVGLVPENDAYISAFGDCCDEVIFCWGSTPDFEDRVAMIRSKFPAAKCFGTTKDGSPYHPRALSFLKMLKLPKLIAF